MNLTKSLSLAMGFAGIITFTASAQVVEETFGGYVNNTPVSSVTGGWLSSSGDDSKVVNAGSDAPRLVFTATSTPITNAYVNDTMVLEDRKSTRLNSSH